MEVYIGLLRVDGHEPSEKNGYKRIPVGELSTENIPEFLQKNQVMFPEAVCEGYGNIQSIVAYPDPDRSEFVAKFDLPSPVDVHIEVVPFVYRGNLYRGLAVEAEITLQSDDLCKM